MEHDGRYDVEDRMTRPVIGRVLSYDEFEDYRKSSGFTDGNSGTYYTSGRDVYLYVKRCHGAKTEEQARRNLRVAKHLTGLGTLFPHTRWGVFRCESGEYQLFAVTRALEAYKGQPHIEGREKLVGFEKKDKKRYTDIFKDGSHILNWYRRVDPNFNPKSEPGEDDLACLLNPFEAWHRDNWGWSRNGKLFPIDVEVIGFESEKDIAVVNRWCEKNPLRKVKRIHHIKDTTS